MCGDMDHGRWHGNAVKRSPSSVRITSVVDGVEAAPPLMVVKYSKLIHLVGDCIFLIKLDELDASTKGVYDLNH